MRMKHIILEGYCNFDSPPGSCKCSDLSGQMGCHCLDCPEFSWTIAPNELALSNDMGAVETLKDWIAPDTDMVTEMRIPN